MFAVTQENTQANRSHTRILSPRRALVHTSAVFTLVYTVSYVNFLFTIASGSHSPSIPHASTNA